MSQSATTPPDQPAPPHSPGAGLFFPLVQRMGKRDVEVLAMWVEALAGAIGDEVMHERIQTESAQRLIRLCVHLENCVRPGYLEAFERLENSTQVDVGGGE